MTTAAPRLQSFLLALLALCTVAALAGYAVFGLHPRLIGSGNGLARTYALAVTGFPRLHIALGFLSLLALAWRAAPRAWIGAALALYGTSLLSEVLGTSVGWPFGPYHYTPALGPRWFGLVPLLIPLSWCTMTLASFVIVRCILGVRSRLTTIAAGALLLIAWDLALDPAMSRLTPYWVWSEQGPYFGMPLLNLAGWFVTGIALHAILLALGAQRWADVSSPETTFATAGIYAANFVLPLGMTVAAGLPMAAVLSLAALALAIVLTRIPKAIDRRAVRQARHAEIAR
jgi:uncharacterized membrane protein